MNILVFQHLDVETPGSFLPLFKADGARVETVRLNHGEPIPDDLTRFDILVVMGGPQDVWQEDQFPWLKAEKAAIATFVRDLRRPYLGVCLGHQLLAEAIGGSVGKAKQGEVGVMSARKTSAGLSDPLFNGISDPVTVLQWHGAEVLSLPKEAVVLAASDACAVQAFRYGPHAYGLQFHVEVTQNTVEEWAGDPENAKALEAALGKNAAAGIRSDVSSRLPAFNADAATIWRNFKSTWMRAAA